MKLFSLLCCGTECLSSVSDISTVSVTSRVGLVGVKGSTTSWSVSDLVDVVRSIKNRSLCGDGVLILSSVSDSSTTCAKGDACIVGIEGAGEYSAAGVVFRDRDRLLVAGSSIARGDVFGLSDCERRPRRLGAAGVAAGLRRLGGIATTAAVVDGAISGGGFVARLVLWYCCVSGNALVSLTETEVCI